MTISFKVGIDQNMVEGVPYHRTVGLVRTSSSGVKHWAKTLGHSLLPYSVHYMHVIQQTDMAASRVTGHNDLAIMELDWYDKSTLHHVQREVGAKGGHKPIWKLG